MAIWNGSGYSLEDLTFDPQPTTAVVGIATTVAFLIQSTAAYTVEDSNGTVSIGNTSGLGFNILTSTRPGWLTGRRLVKGQLYPRGVYNK
jgi:hypothetical protein